MGARGPMQVLIHRCNPFLLPQIRDVVEKYLWEPDAAKVMAGEPDFLDEYRSSAGEELAVALVDVDPSMVIEVYANDGEYEGFTIHVPDLGWYQCAAVDGEPARSCSDLNVLLEDKPDDLPGAIDRLIGNPWFRAIEAIPSDDPNRLTKKENP